MKKSYLLAIVCMILNISLSFTYAKLHIEGEPRMVVYSVYYAIVALLTLAVLLRIPSSEWVIVACFSVATFLMALYMVAVVPKASMFAMAAIALFASIKLKRA